jgi:adenylate cyclase
MEAYAPVGGIQVTERTYELLKDEYEFERRDEVPIKGKGIMTTYVLTRRKGDQPMPLPIRVDLAHRPT